MTESHFNYTGYHYCFNNPMIFTDPFGLDTSLVNDNGEKEVIMDAINRTAKKMSWLGKIWSKTKRGISSFFSSGIQEGDGDTQAYGEAVTAEGADSRNSTKSKAEVNGEGIEADALLAINPNPGPKFFKVFKSYYGEEAVDLANSFMRMGKVGNEINKSLSKSDNKINSKNETDNTGKTRNTSTIPIPGTKDTLLYMWAEEAESVSVRIKKFPSKSFRFIGYKKKK